MRRSRRAKSIFTILSLVMAITVMLGSFMAFADESSDWREQNRDQGEATHEVNVLDKRDDKVYSWEKNLLSGSGGDDGEDKLLSSDGLERSSDLQVGISGVHQIGYSEPPLGYSMTVTYDYYGEEAPLGVSSIGPNGGAAPSLGFSVIVEDGDLVPDEAELYIAVDADVPAGASPLFKVLVNDNELANDETDLTKLQFRGGYTVTEDGVIVVEPVPLLIAPMSLDDINTITVDSTSLDPTGWRYTDSTNSLTPPSYNWTNHYVCAYCYGQTYTCNQATTKAGGSSSTAGNTNTTGLTASNSQIWCDVNRWVKYHAAGTGNQLNINFSSPQANSANGTGGLFPQLTAQVPANKKPSTIRVNGVGASTAAGQPQGTNVVDMATVAGIAGYYSNVQTTITYNNVNMNATAHTIQNTQTGGTVVVNLQGYSYGASPTYTPTGGVVGGAGAVTVGQDATLTGSGAVRCTTGSPAITVTGNGTLNHPNLNNVGNVIMNSANARILGSTHSVGTGQITDGSVGINNSTQGTLTCDGNISLSGANSFVRNTGALISNSTATTTPGAIIMNGGTVEGTGEDDRGKLQAWSGKVFVTGTTGKVHRINAKEVDITSAGVIDVVSMVNGANSTIDDGDIVVLYAGGTVTVNSPTTITGKAYAGPEYATPALAAGTNIHLTIDGVNTPDIPLVFGGGGVASTTTAGSQITLKGNAGVTNVFLGSDWPAGTVNKITLNHDAATTGEINGGSGSSESTPSGFPVRTNAAAQADVTTSIINMNGGMVTNNIFGGGTATNNVGSATINLKGGTVTRDVFGGPGSETAARNTEAAGATVTNSYVNYVDTATAVINGSLGIHGGGKTGTVSVSSNVVIDENLAKSTRLPNGHIYGGGSEGAVTTANVTIAGTQPATVSGGVKVYGGSSGTTAGRGRTDTANVTINTTPAGAVTGANVYGGSSGVGTTGKTLVTVDGTVGATTVPQQVYGGGSGTGDIDGGTSGDQAVVVVNGMVYGDVFGGSDNATGTSDITTHSGTRVNITGTVEEGNVYGGCNENGGTAGDITNGTHVNIIGGTVGDTVTPTPQNVYGGGIGGSITSGNSTYGTNVQVSGTSQITGEVYGGGTNNCQIDTTNVNVVSGQLDGDVFGGNENGTVKELATVSITGTTVVSPGVTIYGGGNNGSPTGDTDVTISVDVTDRNVYGGGLNSPIEDMANSDGSTLIKITGGTIGTASTSETSVYGGGRNTLGNANNARVEAKSSVVINGATVTKNVYGGGDSAPVNNTDVDIQTGALINGNVFGGGENESTTADRAFVSENTLVKINGGTVDLNVYGGGDDDGNNVGMLPGNTRVANVQVNTGLVKGNVFGGGFDSTADTTNVIVKTAVNKNVYGGGHSNGQDSKIRNDIQSYTPATQVEIAAGAQTGLVGTDGNVFGGGTDDTSAFNAQVTGNTQVTVSGGDVGHNATVDRTATVYGGGENNTVTGVTVVNMTNGTVHRDVFGGGLDAGGFVNSGAGNTATVTTVTISGGTVNGGTADAEYNTNGIGGGVYGGGYDGATIFGSTRVLINGTAAIGTAPTTGNSVYGGGLQAHVEGNTDVEVNSATANVYRNVYGGGRKDSEIKNAAGGTKIQILAGTVHHNVYGGGLDNSKIAGNTDILIKANVGTVSPADSPVSNLGSNDVVFGGGTGLTGSVVDGKTLINIEGNAVVKADVHGGGDRVSNHILGAGGAEINTKDSAVITGNMFGGGLDSDVEKTVVNHDAEINGTIWGGGVSRALDAPVKTDGATVTLTGGVVNDNTANSALGDVHGGGFSAAGQNAHVAPFTYVKLQSSSVVEGSVYGGGQVELGTTGKAEVNNDVTVEILSDSHVKTDVWGGGHGEPTNADVTGNVKMILTDAKVGTVKGGAHGNVWGGGHDSAIKGVITIDTDGDTTIYGMVHGGGMATVGNENDAAVNASTNEDVVITITFKGNTNVKGNVYGGGLFGHVYGSIKMDVHSKSFEENIYGGGHNADVEWNDFVHVYQDADVGHSVYGGGIKDDPATVPSNTYTVGGYTDVIIDGHIHGSVYGGGHRIDVMNNANYGGKGATVRITTNATIGDDPLIGSDTDYRGTVYGGGHDANIANPNHGGTYVHLTGDAEVWWDVYGGGWNDQSGTVGAYGNVAGPEGTYVELKDNSHVHHNVYGGGRNFGDVTHVNEGGTVVLLDDKCEVGDFQSRGDVFGGGNYGHIWGKNGTKVTLMPYAIVHGTIYGGCYYADVKHPNSGTEVYIYGQVGDTYHTNSYYDPRPSFYDGSDFDFYNSPVAKTGNVYGGGNHGNIDGDRGTKMLITDQNSGREKAVVWNSAYGGGFEGDVKYDTIVDVNGAAEVYNSVFGGGQQHETNPYLGNTLSAYIHGTTTVNVTDENTKIGRWDMTRLEDNDELTGGRTGGAGWVENNNLELHTGRIFGGGDFATVAKNSTVTVDSLKQVAFRTISGGSFGVLSVNTPDDRNLVLNKLGRSQGHETEDTKAWGDGIYDELKYYTVIKHLHDYTRADVTDSFLTVYYHHRSADDNSDFGLEYPGYSVDTQSGDYESQFLTFGGKYHPWRPYPHKDIIVDPIFTPSGTMFRMEAGYTIDMRPGGIQNSNTSQPQLLIDRTFRRLTATSKVYGPSNNIMDPTTFLYNYLPRTLNPKNLIDRRSTAICGINFYIPPIEIKPIDGDTTNFGGTDVLDGTTGNTGAPEYEATDRTVSVKANEKDLVNKVEDAVKKTAKGKTTYVSESRYDQYTAEILTAVNKAALNAGGKVILMADTMNGNAVQGRMYLDPAKITGKTINTRVYTTSDRISQAKVNFQNYYKNNFAFVQLSHTGAIGTEVEIAAKVKLDTLNTKNLIFYTYNASSNSYKRIENPRYFIDKNGYLHFHTSVGGTVVITDKPLARK